MKTPWRAHPLPRVLPLMVCTFLLLLSLFWLIPATDRGVLLDIGAEGPFRAPDETATVRRFAGFHAPELADRRSFRWTQQWARLVVPYGRQIASGLVLQLTLCGCRPAGSQPTVALAVDNLALAELPTSGMYRRYTLLLPPGSGPAGDVFVELRSATAEFAGREVGVRADTFMLTGYGGLGLASALGVALALFGGVVAVGAGSIGRWSVVGGQWSPVVLLLTLVLGPVLLLATYRHQWLPPGALVFALLCGVLFTAVVRPNTLAAMLLAGLTVAMVLVPGVFGSWLIDDAFISFRYAQNLVAGHGLVFNPGERVEGYTNFLWTLGAALVLGLGADPTAVAQLATLLIGLALLVLSYSVGRQVSTFATFVAPLLVATSAPVLLYTARGSGMETGLFALLVLAGVALYLRATAQAVGSGWHLMGAGAVFALAALTRPEGVLVAGISGLHLLGTASSGRRWPLAMRFTGAFLLIYLPYYLGRFSYYGLPLPNTFYVKVGASQAQFWRGLGYLAEYWRSEGWAWLVGLLLTLWVLMGRTRQPTLLARRGWWPLTRAVLANPPGYLLLLVGMYLAYIAAVGGDWIPGARFVVPIVPLLALLAQVGLAQLAGQLRWGRAVVLLLIVVAVFDHGRGVVASDAANPANLIWRENEVVARRREVGRWLAANSPPTALVAVEAAGALPYYSRLPTLDILGLNDRYIAALNVPTMGQGKPGHEKTDIGYVLDRQPTIIPEFAVPYVAGEPRFAQGYARETHDGPEGYTVVVYRRRVGVRLASPLRAGMNYANKRDSALGDRAARDSRAGAAVGVCPAAAIGASGAAGRRRLDGDGNCP